MTRRLESSHSIEDLRRLARRRLPWGMWEFLEGGSDDEWSVRNNTAAFGRYELVPRTMVDVTSVDTKTRVIGIDLSWPVMLSPVGMTRMYHGDGERAVARAAERSNTLYTLATFAAVRLEEIAELSSSPKMFQLFINPGWDRSLDLVARAQAAGYDALCLTVDSTAAPNKERDYRTGIDPGRITLRNLISILAHPRWIYGVIRGGSMRLANLDADPFQAKDLRWSDAAKLTWERVEAIRKRWQGPFALKGILNPGDARRAADAGVDALILSNHGGRQMDCLPAPVDWIAPTVEAVGERLEIIVDSGVRRGSDVIKAIALGAKACMIGRPYVYGLAAGGQAGVERAIDLLRTELVRDMRLLGLTSIAGIDESLVRRIGPG